MLVPIAEPISATVGGGGGGLGALRIVNENMNRVRNDQITSVVNLICLNHKIFMVIHSYLDDFMSNFS